MIRLTILTLALIFVTLLVGCAPTPTPTIAPTKAPTKITSYSVTYRISGNANRVNITYVNSSGGVDQKTVVPPFKDITFTMQPGTYVSLAVQNHDTIAGARRTVKAEILVNGSVVKEAESSGAFVVASCGGLVQ